jgi:septum site-determining protein MinC
MSEDVMFKGSRYGLQLVLSDQTDFSIIEKQLKDKLESAFNFFCQGTVIRIAEDRLTQDQMGKLGSLLERYGLSLKAVDLSSAENNEKTVKAEHTDNEEIPGIRETTIIERTVRGGDEVICNGSVVIYGNVNPGATVIAGGNIDVRGTCRGIVHAGAFGDMEAFVIADHMMAMQVRIAELIARAPDHIEKSENVEKALVKNGQIVIEPAQRNEEAGK